MIKDYLVNFHDNTFECVDEGFGNNVPVDVVVRPEDIKIVKEDQAMIKGVVQSATFKGVHYEMIVNSGTFNWIVHSTYMSAVGSKVGLVITPADIHIMKRR